jgi:transcriptional regulator with XRE-family HTH domain
MVPTKAEPFGTRLRRERERRQITLSSISANTKISVALFEALEREDVSRWPVGIYRRGFIRAYAQGIGLDADAVVKEFLERFPDPSEPATPEKTDQAAAAPKAAAVQPVVRVTLASAAAPFVGGCLLADLRRRVAAAACDAGVVVAIAVTMFVVFDRFWAPLSAAMLGYYLGGIVLLGNTPGVCLLAPQDDRPGQGGHTGRRPILRHREIFAQLRARAKRGPIAWWRAPTRV